MARRPNWHFIGLLSLSVWVPLLIWLLDVDPRVTGTLLGFTAFIACTWRFVACYPYSPAVARAALVVILLSLLTSAIGQAQAATMGLPATVVVYPVIGQRVLCLLLALYWERLLHLDRDTPWVTPPGTSRRDQQKARKGARKPPWRPNP